MKETRNGQQAHQPIPCAQCGTAPAQLDCAVTVSALGLGEIVVYLCQKDYEALSTKQQADQISLGDDKHEQFQRMSQEVAACGLRLHGGQWPPRQVLWEESLKTGNHLNEARAAYRVADDQTDDGKQARLRVLRWSGLCLYEAICFETVATLEGGWGSAVNGTLFCVTAEFMRKGLTLPKKQITKQQVYAAMWAVLHYREGNAENEAEELAAIEREMTSEGI